MVLQNQKRFEEKTEIPASEETSISVLSSREHMKIISVELERFVQKQVKVQTFRKTFHSE